MACEDFGDGPLLYDCEVTKSARTQQGSWLIGWRLVDEVDDDPVTGQVLFQPDSPIALIDQAAAVIRGEDRR